MPRTFEITVPPDASGVLVERASALPDVVGVRLQRGAGVQPAGDVVAIDSLNRGLHAVMALLDELGLPEGRITVRTAEPTSLVHAPMSAPIVLDSSESTWEEMERMVAKESNMTVNALLIMGVAGASAAAGLLTNALHLVIAGMLIAPGFEPLARIPLSLVARGRTWRYGLWHTLSGYLALAGGAVVMGLLLGARGIWPAQTEGSYLPVGVLVDYWTQFSPVSLLVSAAASAAGGLLIVTNRSILTAGVMVALALVPVATIAAVALAAGQVVLAGTAAIRLLVEMLLVVTMSGVVFGVKRATTHRRRVAA